MISSNVSSADGNNAGLWIELDAILAVVIGGTSLTGGRFSIAGTVLGALLIQTLTTTIYTIGIPPQTTLLFKALVVIVVCLVQSPAFRAKVARPPAPRDPPPPRARGRRSPESEVPRMTDDRPPSRAAPARGSRSGTCRCWPRSPCWSSCTASASLQLPTASPTARSSSTSSSTTRSCSSSRSA